MREKLEIFALTHIYLSTESKNEQELEIELKNTIEKIKEEHPELSITVHETKTI